MIITMLIQGNPGKKVLEVPTREGIRREVTYRSDGQDIPAAIKGSQIHERAKRFGEAIEAYAEPLKDGNLSMKEATRPLRAIAAVYLKQDRKRGGSDIHQNK
jgi:hypothetical protein